MNFIEKIFSKLDNTIKYVFKTNDNLIIEFSYLNKNDGKDIICIPSQTMCNIGCKFCHTTDFIGKIKSRNLTLDEIYSNCEFILNDLNIYSNDRTLLLSFMGCGEPILNVEEIVLSMLKMKKDFESKGIPYVRFAIATSIPKFKAENFFDLTFKIYRNELPVKLHLSLHYTFDLIRKDWMLASLDIMPSLSAIDFYKKITNNVVEIHYTLIENVNDTEQDAILLSNFLKDKNINVKFLFFNEKESINYHASNKNKLSLFKKYLDKYNIQHEYYIPVGLDIGASCGQFLMDYYVKYVE